MPYMAPSLCRELLSLICRPFWNGNTSVLRYVLQWAVAYRYQLHAPPPCPIPHMPPAEREDLGRRNTDKQETVAFAMKLLCIHTEPLSARPELDRLLKYIEELARSKQYLPDTNPDFPHDR